MKNPISITSFASISALGTTAEEVWKSYLNINKHCISTEDFSGEQTLISKLNSLGEKAIIDLQNSSPHYKNLDRSVLLGVLVAKRAFEASDWDSSDHFGINMGSSRGATQLFEKYHSEFISTNKSSTLSSPTTTLGNISSWIAHELQSNGPEISHSITCSTALHSVLNGVAWINSGMTKKFMVGGSEAPLTPFTIAQMKALKIYSNNIEDNFPCKTLDFSKKKNQMFLGEGAAIFCLEQGLKKKAKALITGIGYGTEVLKHNISISTNADCFQTSMKMAIGNTPLSEIDAIVMHAPGTIKGDLSEHNAIQKIFGQNTPLLTSNKWKIGHSFGASGALSLELAILMLQHQQFIAVPFIQKTEKNKPLQTILVNAVGFGGNAVTIKVEKTIF